MSTLPKFVFLSYFFSCRTAKCPVACWGSKATQLELDLWVAVASLNLTHVPHKLCLLSHTHIQTPSTHKPNTHKPSTQASSSNLCPLTASHTFRHFSNLESGTKNNVSGKLKRFSLRFGSVPFLFYFFVYNLRGPHEPRTHE